jgi:pyruvate kinase
VDAVSQSFVSHGRDIEDLLAAADEVGHRPFVIAKIERLEALDNLDSILEVADGPMVARGDLGVEIPISRMAVVQKELMEKANQMGKPVVTATQMLESMTAHRRPTRAEATDVANAVLDGTDGLMLSGESAVGKYPIEAVAMLAEIAAAVEPHRPSTGQQKVLKTSGPEDYVFFADLISMSVETTLERVSPAALIVPTESGHTARMIARFKPHVWITAVSPQEHTCQCLQFSYGVCPVYEPEHPEDWTAFARNWLQTHGLEGNLVVLTEGPSPEHPKANHRMELIDLSRPGDDEE